MQKVASLNGIEIFHIDTEKFKTNTINVFFLDKLDRDTVTRNALIPAVLKRGSESHPTFQEIALYLEDMYGATFDCGVVKKGECQIIQFYLEYVFDLYTGENSRLFEKSFDLICEIITQPVTEAGVFKDDYISQEKENLKRHIESRINDKVQYAVERCFEEMCKGEPFEIYEYGSVEDLADIDSRGLYEYYKYFLDSLPMAIFITGQMDENKLKYMTDRLYGMKRGRIKSFGSNFVQKDIKDVKEVTERLSINQGKLSMGFRTNIPPSSKEYYTLLVYNGILGGGIHSKLFQNVREKESLAYYAFSRIEKFKNLMVISSGIEIENKDKAIKIIIQQLEEIKNGNISDYEYETTIKTLDTGINSMKDSQLQIVDFSLSQLISGTNDTFDSIIEKIRKVSKQEIIDISRKIQLDTIYFLNSNQ